MRLHSKKKGFTLIELILVISVGMAMSMLTFNSMIKGQEDSQSKALGEQIKKVSEATNLYITNHFDDISQMKNASGAATDPGPRTCTAATLSCSITISSLKNEGLLSNNYSDKNIFGAGYNITIKRAGTAPYYTINGVIVTDKSLITGNSGAIRYDMLGKAMQTAGIDSGMTRSSATVLEGYKGLWSNTVSNYSDINKLGLLGYQVGYDSYSYSVFLRRDGTLPMTGVLNMDSHDINAAKNITASAVIQGQTLKSTGDTNVGANLTTAGTSTLTGAVSAANTITAQGKIRSESYFEGKNGGGDGFRIGGSDANDIEFALYTPGKPLTVWRNGGASSESRFNVLGSQGINGDLRITAGSDGATTGLLQTAGNISTNRNIATNGYDPNEIPPGFSAGGIRTYDVVATGSFYSIKAGTTIAEGKYGFYARQDGNVMASGNMTVAGTITGGYLSASTVVASGSTCPTVGLLSRDAAGQVLSCKAGIWQPEQPVGIPQPWPSDTPPAGWLVCNGQAFNTTLYPLLAKAYPSGRVPDLRGTFIRGLDQGRGIDGGRGILTEQRSSVVGGTDDNWASNEFGVLHGPSSAYSRDSINVYDYTTGSGGQDPKYWIHMSDGTGPALGAGESVGVGITLQNNGSNGFYGGARPYNTAFVYIVRAL